MSLHSINTERGLYVIACGDGFTSLGFDYAHKRACDVALWLRSKAMPLSSYAQAARALLPLDPKLYDTGPKPGTAEHYAAYRALMDAGREFNRVTGERCPAQLVPALIGKEGRRVECTHYGERVRFYVGKSTGWLPCHLMIKTRRCSGGESIVNSAEACSDVVVVG